MFNHEFKLNIFEGFSLDCHKWKVMLYSKLDIASEK